jgi:hypothetical protein
MKWLTLAILMGCLSLSACSSGPIRRVSEPAANIQQLTVRADGSWSVDVRIDNFSSIPMRFDSVALALTVGGESAGTLQARPALSIGPESADVATIALRPSAPARIVIADAVERRQHGLVESRAFVQHRVDDVARGVGEPQPREQRVRAEHIEKHEAHVGQWGAVSAHLRGLWIDFGIGRACGTAVELLLLPARRRVRAISAARRPTRAPAPGCCRA